MIKLPLKSLIIHASILILFCSSCSKVDPIRQDSLLGKWVLVSFTDKVLNLTFAAGMPTPIDDNLSQTHELTLEITQNKIIFESTIATKISGKPLDILKEKKGGSL